MGRKTRRSAMRGPETEGFGFSEKDYNPRQLYAQALRADPQQKPTDPEFYYRQALANATSGRLLESVADCTAALSLDGTFMKALLHRAKCYMDLDKFEEALEDYKKALSMEYFPNKRRLLAEAICALRAKRIDEMKAEGKGLYSAGCYTEAYNIYTAALNVDPNNNLANAKLYFNRALIHVKLGYKLKMSVKDCTTALRLDPTYLKALLLRAQCYVDLECFEDAINDYQTALKIAEKRYIEEIRRLLSEAQEKLAEAQEKFESEVNYKILGISKNASLKQIKAAHKKLARKWHTDKHPNATNLEKKELNRKFVEMRAAYEAIMSQHMK